MLVSQGEFDVPSIGSPRFSQEAKGDLKVIPKTNGRHTPPR